MISKYYLLYLLFGAAWTFSGFCLVLQIGEWFFEKTGEAGIGGMGLGVFLWCLTILVSAALE